MTAWGVEPLAAPDAVMVDAMRTPRPIPMEPLGRNLCESGTRSSVESGTPTKTIKATFRSRGVPGEA